MTFLRLDTRQPAQSEGGGFAITRDDRGRAAGLRDGLRMVAQLIARHHLAQVQTVAAEPGATVSADPGLSAAQNERYVG